MPAGNLHEQALLVGVILNSREPCCPTFTYNCHSDHLARFIAVIISGKKTESSPIVITVLPYLGQKVPNQAGPGEEGGGGESSLLYFLY